MVGVITLLTADDLPEVLATAPRLAEVGAATAGATGWVARDVNGTVVGAVVDLPGRAGDAPPGAWSASSPRTLTDLYTVAAESWLGAGVTTHRVVLPQGDVLEPVLLDLGFGHQQAYGSVPLATVRRAGGPGPAIDVRVAERPDLPALVDLVPLVARHQGGSPAFAPRTPEFFAQLPASLEEFVGADGQQALVALDGSATVGFVLLEHDGPAVEVVLAGTLPERQGRGVGRALLAGAAAWAESRGAELLVADWRTTNPSAARFWRSAGFAVDAHRWARTVDATPD